MGAARDSSAGLALPSVLATLRSSRTLLLETLLGVFRRRSSASEMRRHPPAVVVALRLGGIGRLRLGEQLGDPLHEPVGERLWVFVWRRVHRLADVDDDG